MSDVVYLGRVRWVRESSEKNYRHAIVEPLIQSSEDQNRWIGSIENPVSEFPARGFVFWHDAPKGLEEGDVRQFDIEPHPFYKGEPDKDAFTVRNHKYPMEIIDLRDVGSERDIRILLTTSGVFLNDGPVVERCVLWIQDEKLVGPVNLIRRSGTSSWIFASTQRLETIRCTKIPLEAIQQVELDGTRYLLSPNQDNLGQHVGFANWEADEVLAKRVFNRLLKRDRKTAQALKITKEVFNAYMATIEHAGLVGSHLEQELAFHERIEEIIDVISTNDRILDEAANVCFSIDPVKEKVEEKAENEYQKKLLEQQKRLDEELSDKRAELEAAANSLDEKEKDLSSIEKRIRDLEEKLEERVSGFETELENKLRNLAEKPERLFAEMAVAKVFAPTKFSPNPTKTSIPVGRRTTNDETDIPLVDDSKAFMEALFKRLLSAQISPIVGHELHATLLAGLVPVLIGSESYDVVSMYAEYLTGGILHWIPVGGSIFEPADLLARYDPVTRCLIPHPGGILDILLDESNVLHIVVLDGFNRAAVDGYLIPLLQSLQDGAKGRNARSIPLAPPGFAHEEDMYANVFNIAWKRNVLLVLCPSIGTSTLPIPSEFWDFCSIIDTSAPAPVEVKPETESTSRITRVPTTVWNTWIEDAKEKIEPVEALETRPEKIPALPPIILGNIQSICRAGVSLGLKRERALEQAVKTTLFPYLVATEERVDVWFQHLEVTLNEADRKLGDAIRRLGE